jgi:hypothetical protein
MSAPNVWVAVANPDRLIDGTDPMAPFVVASIQLYRYTTEALARAGGLGTLVTTFTLVASSTATSELAGPYRYGVYDSNATHDSWYRYRFADAGLANFSPLSDPWQAGNALTWELRDLIYEVGNVMGGEVKRGTATAGATTSLTCTALFKSSVRDSRWFRGWYVLIDETTDTAAPQGEERLIASVDTATGIATLDNDLSAAVGAGDIFQLHLYASPLEMVRCINRVRERMFLLVNHEIAINEASGAGNRYPVPQGIRSNNDVIDVSVKTVFTDSDWETLNKIQYNIEFDGLQGWLELPYQPVGHVIRVRYEKSYRQLEGELSAMSDFTRAPIEWLRKAAAWEVYKLVDESDGAATTFGKWVGMTGDEVNQLSGRYAPNIVRRMNTGQREAIGPRMVR